ncbi:MAG: hypothetical protein Q9227_007628 [Pyrenula ochraceoflavens]
MDEGYLESIPEIDKVQSPTSAGSAASPSLPTLPLAVDPLNRDTLAPAQKPYADRASSIYSQPSPRENTKFQRDSARDSVRPPSSVWSDVSPPDSPRQSYDQPDRGSPNISPLEEKHTYQRPYASHDKFKSSLPVPRQAPPIDYPQSGKYAARLQRPRPTAPTSTRDTRWDDFSGEPTTSDKGRPSSVKPGQQEPFGQGGTEKVEKKSLFSGLRERDPAKRRAAMQRIRDDAMETTPQQREPWKGASGRSSIPPPMKTDPNAKLTPLQIPKNHYTVEADNIKVPPSEASELARKTIRPVAPSSSSDNSIKPTPPLKAGSNSPYSGRSPVSSTHPSNPITSQLRREGPSPAPRQTPSPARHTPSPASQKIQPPVMPPSAPTRSANDPPDSNQKPYKAPEISAQDEAQIRAGFNGLGIDDQPQSRFSATTHGTSVHDSPGSSPRASVEAADAPPVPSLPSPMMMRKRPVPAVEKVTPPVSQITNVKATARKPTPSERARRSSVESGATFDTMNTGKALPSAPPTLKATSRLESLNAELDSLSHRRANINSILRDLTAVIQPTSNLAYDYATRSEVRETVKKLQGELDDISREEHDLGLKVLRVRKKMDQQDGNWAGEGVLWVKRVTS